MILCLLWSLSALFLVGSSSLVVLIQTLSTLGKAEVYQGFKAHPWLFAIPALVIRWFPKDSWQNVLYLLKWTFFLLYSLYLVLFFSAVSIMMDEVAGHWTLLISTLSSLSISITLGSFVYLFSMWMGRGSTNVVVPFITFIANVFILCLFPLIGLSLYCYHLLLSKDIFQVRGMNRTRAKMKLLDWMEEEDLGNFLEPLDLSLVHAIASLHDRVVKEIMVPRMDVVALSTHQTIHEASQKMTTERYSRIPVYREQIDDIVGVLLYKDVMEYYFRTAEDPVLSPKKALLQDLIKPVLYTPETKPISHLLQEFRHQRNHMAIVVDEYGGTAGIVTCEDILEEVVGDIIDEDDTIEEEKLYVPLAGGGWLVDAKMHIVDLEKELGIVIPHQPEYDTVGGYLFHRTGMIPSNGWRMHSDLFDLEVVSSNHRSVEKVKIFPSTSGESVR